MSSGAMYLRYTPYIAELTCMYRDMRGVAVLNVSSSSG